MKQTAVDWLDSNLIHAPRSQEDFTYNYETFERAKIMEQEQKETIYSEEDMQDYAKFCIRCYENELPCIIPKDWVEHLK
jgi:hypothetical protein